MRFFICDERRRVLPMSSWVAAVGGGRSGTGRTGGVARRLEAAPKVARVIRSCSDVSCDAWSSSWDFWVQLLVAFGSALLVALRLSQENGLGS